MKKRDRNHGTESSRVKSIRKKINLKCLEMKEKMKQHNSLLLNEEEINTRVLIFRQMLFEKEEVQDEDDTSNQPIENAVDSKKGKTSKKSKKNKGEKEQGIGNINGKSKKPVDLNSTSKNKRTNSELSSKPSTPHAQIVNGISPALSQKSKTSQKIHKNAKSSSPLRLHSSGTRDVSKDALAHRRSAKSSIEEALTELHRHNSRSLSAEKRHSRSYSRSMSPQEWIRDRSSDRHSSHRRSLHSRDRSVSRSISRSRSPSIRRRKGSPSHLDRRRITRL